MKRSYFCEFIGVEGNSQLERILGDSSWGERYFSTNELVFVKMHDNTMKATVLCKENSVAEANS